MANALTLDRRLAEMGADLDLLAWVRHHDDLASAWAEYQRGDWLLWIAASLAGTPEAQRAVVTAAAACARLGLPFGPRQSPGPASAIEAAESWAKGLASAAIVDTAAHGAAYAAMASFGDDRAWAAASAVLAHCADIVRARVAPPSLPPHEPTDTTRRAAS